MATRAKAFYARYKAVNATTGVPMPGDVANHTLRWVKDGTPSAPTNSPSEIDATNLPGVYQVLITAQEADADSGHLSGTSSTSDIVIIGTEYAFETDPARVISGGNIIHLSPVGQGTLRLVKGDSYKTANGRQLDFVKPTGANWPTDLTGATVTLTLNKADNQAAGGDDTQTASGSVVVATGDSQTVRVELATAVTDGLLVGANTYDFDVVAVVGGERATLVTGVATIVENQTVIA